MQKEVVRNCEINFFKWKPRYLSTEGEIMKPFQGVQELKSLGLKA